MTATKDWQKARKLSYILYRGMFNDTNLSYETKNVHGEDLANQVIDFFEHGSLLVFPAKYVFCNIVYAYYLSKYFGEDFYKCLDDPEVLFDTPCKVLYSDDRIAYDIILRKVLPSIESYPSIVKTRHYFKMEFLINDEDISDVAPTTFIK